MKRSGSTPGVKKLKNSHEWNTGEKVRQKNCLAHVRKNIKRLNKKGGIKNYGKCSENQEITY